MSLYVKLSMQEIADGLTAIGWSGAGGGGDASLSYGSTAPLAPTNGTLWYDTTEEILKLFRVDAWVNINVTQSVVNNINAQVTLAQSYAQDAQEALSGFTSIVATATTLAPESSATATFNATTGVLTLGIPQGTQGQGLSPKGTDTVANILLKSGINGDYWIASDTGDGYIYSGSAWVNVGAVRGPQGPQGIQGIQGDTGPQGIQGPAGADGLSGVQLNTANTFTAPQRTNTSASSNAIDFRIANNFTINATAANITVTSLLGCIGQSGVIVIESAENITGWGAEFNFKTVPTSMSGMEVFSYFVQTETVIRIGRVS